ncbi:MAG TPA: FxsA family protein [Solirubrobacteraceae bacterium]|jgi:UPF0716 protein FxsA|nr:FxsA family protein [Solirubrobacteraceae bacterium]
MPLLILLFIVVPIAEIYVIIQVGQAIGALWTIALLIADSILGSMLMRSQGRAAWRRFNAAIASGRPPAREVFDGALVIFGGAFLLAPGFITDVLGLSLLLPPTRALYRRFIVTSVLGRTPAGRAAMYASRAARRRRPPSDVEGTAHEVPSDPPRLP